MKLEIRQNKLLDEIKRKIFQGFARQAITSTGIDGLNEDPISFEIVNGSEFMGAIVVQLFWNQLHIKYLFVEENYRGQGLARQLMDHALEFGKKRGCQFAFVETMSFQAPEFYQIGMIYRANGCRLLKGEKLGDLQHIWIDLMALSEGQCSKLLWKWRMMQ